MTHIRWYDKDQQLKLIMETWEQMDNDVKESVAEDLVQMMVQRKYPFTDDLIEEINQVYVPVRRRWYDQDETLHSAIEMLKYINPEDKGDVLKEILYTILYFKEMKECAKYEDNEEYDDLSRD